MKIFSALFLLMMLSLVSCGGKSGGGGNSSGVFSNALTTQEGYLDLQSQNLEFGSQAYTPQIVSQYQQNIQILNNAFSTARNSGIQQVIVNGRHKFRARMSAQLISPYSYTTSGYTNGYGNGYPNSYPSSTAGSYGGVPGQTMLVIQNIIFY